MTKSSLIPILAFWVATASAQTPAPASKITVKVETLKVNQGRDAASPVLATLKQGAEVLIDMSMTGEDNAQWCTIREPGKKERLGYVRCDTLDRPARPTKARPVVAVTALPPEPVGPVAKASFGQARWMGYTDMMASTFKFDATQRQQIRQLANQNGIPSCIQTTDSHQGPGPPPDILPNSPVTPCHWWAQTFYEQVLGLLTPEQKIAYKKELDRFTKELSKGKTTLAARPQAKQ